MHLTLVETCIAPVPFSKIDVLFVRELSEKPLAALIVRYDHDTYARNEERTISSPLPWLTGGARSSFMIGLNNPI